MTDQFCTPYKGECDCQIGEIPQSPLILWQREDIVLDGTKKKLAGMGLCAMTGQVLQISANGPLTIGTAGVKKKSNLK